MILTLTPNPSVDRTISVAALSRGTVHRATTSRVDPGGKGVNVSRALVAHRLSTLAVLPAGGPEGAQLAEMLDSAGVPMATVPLASPTRSNVTIVEPDGTTTKINEPGPEISEAEVRAIAERVASLAITADWVVLSGSLPRGVPDSFYADLTGRLKAIGAQVAVDTSGAALSEAVTAAPDLIKPNDEELAELAGRDLHTWGDAVDAARELRAAGVGTVLVSLGPDGALLIGPHGVARAFSPPVAVRSTVGAGDSTLTGYLAGLLRSAADPMLALRTAVAFGTAAVTLPGSVMPGPTDVLPDLVVVEDQPDLAHPLKGGSDD